jgi:hypothetical protein
MPLALVNLINLAWSLPPGVVSHFLLSGDSSLTFRVNEEGISERARTFVLAQCEAFGANTTWNGSVVWERP